MHTENMVSKPERADLPEKGQTWRHYKGTLYEVVGISEHTETNELLILYREKGRDKVWARPAKMWHKDIEGVPRFKFTKDEERITLD